MRFVASLDYMCWLCQREVQKSSDDSRPSHRLSLCRVIGFSQDTIGSNNSATISGIGFQLPSEDIPGHNADPTFAVPSRSDLSVEDVGIAREDVDIMSSPVYIHSQHKWNFRVHADCWEIIESRVEDVVACATTWCKALASLNWNFDPFVAGQSRSRYDLPQLLLPSAQVYEKHNPRQSLQKLQTIERLAVELGFSQPPLSREAMPLSQLGLNPQSHESLAFAREGDDIFSDLPEEIIQTIICFTRTIDLVNLRLASRAVAYTSRLVALPNSFWLSRFMPPFELGFALPKKVLAEQDWRALYFQIRRALDHPSPASRGVDTEMACLAKRKHWWNRLTEVISFHSLRGSGVALAGDSFTRPIPFASGTQQDMGRESNPQASHPIGNATATMVREDGTERVCSTVCLQLPLASSTMTGVGVSVINLGGRRCVSGLRIFYGSSTTPESLGYVLNDLEVVVALEPGESFIGFNVRLSADSILALRVVFRSPSGALRMSSWLGDTTDDLGQSARPPPPIETLALRKSCFGSSPCILAASFDDACRWDVRGPVRGGRRLYCHGGGQGRKGFFYSFLKPSNPQCEQKKISLVRSR
ncbi:hypothetical protein B0T24DRAFT_77304 [Lasiosphaeria ovina]|uniref:F-box domain-containing protein n=1 Tax=Lasiosphaeria ovina TaxID=92902 RepID=A0AAE0NMF2_9PEZI|nr:hypothetical protein B0T24DRAFT_77304 [Lasiosphaeria ovina]